MAHYRAACDVVHYQRPTRLCDTENTKSEGS